MDRLVERRPHHCLTLRLTTRLTPLLAVALSLLAACHDDATSPTAPAPPDRPALTLVDASSFDIGTLGGSYTSAIQMHPNGRVVGFSAIPGDAHYHAFLWAPGQGMRDLGTTGGPNSSGQDVNASGQVAGSSNPDAVAEHAMLWTPGAGMRDLGTLGGTYSLAYALNDAGMVVGRSMIVGGSYHAFAWTAADGMRDLGTLGGTYSEAQHVNASGQVIGMSYLPGDVLAHAFIWTAAGGMRDIGTLDGGSTTARDINAAGAVVGVSDVGTNRHAFIWTAERGMQDLGALPGQVLWNADARDVNDAGQVVGFATVEGGQHAFLWSRDAGMRDLGTLGGANSDATSLDAEGRVVGWSNVPSPVGVNAHGFLWTAADGMEDIFIVTGIRRPIRIGEGLRVLGDNRIGELRTDAHRPIAPDLLVSAAPKRPIAITLSGVSQDGFALVGYAVTTPPVHGTLTGSAPNLTYTSEKRFEGEDGFAYTVTDARGLTSAPGHVTVVVSSANHAPVLSSGGPYAGQEGTPIAFDWSASDVDGGGLAYTWEFGDGTGGAGAHLPKQHRYADGGTYVLRATVTDPAGGSDARETTVAVANVAPTIRDVRLSSDVVALRHGTATVTVRGVDFDDPAGRVDAPFVILIRCGYGSVIADADRRCQYTSAGTYTLTITVADKDMGISLPATATVRVIE